MRGTVTRSRHKGSSPPGGGSAEEVPGQTGLSRAPAGAAEEGGPGRVHEDAEDTEGHEPAGRSGGSADDLGEDRGAEVDGREVDGDVDEVDSGDEDEDEGDGENEVGDEDERDVEVGDEDERDVEDGDEDESDVEDEDEDGDEEPVAGDGGDDWPGDPRTGWILLAAGLMAWLGWGLIRWSPPEDAPPAAVISTAPTSSEPDAAPRGARPEPAATSPGPGGGDGVDPKLTREAAEDDPAADGAQEAEPTPWQPDPGWAKNLEPPAVVRYRIRNGGTLVNVANLYKIFHHEIQALNPGVPLEKELPAGSEVVVYRAEHAKPGRSIGYAGDGRLEGAVPMPDGPGRILKMIPWKSWATPQTIAVIDGVLRQWAGRFPDAMPILVGNLSAPTGGRLPPHSSHQSGRDVDLGYPQKPGVEKEYNWREMDARNLDAARTWDLLKLLAETGAIEAVFMDRKIQKLLHEYAVQHELMTRGELRRWLEYPRPTGSGKPLVRHVKGHVDHLHVRVACAPGDAACKTR